MGSLIMFAVVVELFTSQGCSSCPPADELISELRNTRGVVPLAFHVDYWDRLGWKDPFSSKLWTQRQMMYVGSMKLNSAYTPQAVVNGAKQLVGSSRGALMAAVVEASKQPAVGTVSVQATRTLNAVNAMVQASAPEGYDIVLALFQNRVTTNIRSGENAGRVETVDAVVRRLQRVTNGTVTLPVEASWRDLGVAVFLQNRETLEIRNAAVVGVTP